jgi:GNAT superfamily N-acetyltransferase
MNEPAPTPVVVCRLDPAAAQDADLVAGLVDLINAVYAKAERGLWQPEAQRTTAAEMTRLIEAGEIAVATVDGELAGAVRVRELDETTGEFGMLAAAHQYRGIGVGRDLVAFAEGLSRDRGHRTMQLELLVPRVGKHPNKVFLDDWYSRLGYRVARTMSLDDAYPDLSPLLATECELVIYEKPLEVCVSADQGPGDRLTSASTPTWKGS